MSRFVCADRPPKYHLSSNRSFRDTQKSQVHPDYRRTTTRYLFRNRLSIASINLAMADITEHDPQQSPSAQDDALATGNGASGADNRGIKRSRISAAADEDDDDDDKPGRERRKIEIKFIQDKSRRHITFSKRKAGIMKKVSRISPRRRARVKGDTSMPACDTSRASKCPHAN